MDGPICLIVAGEVHPSKGNPSLNRMLPEPGSNLASLPDNHLHLADIDRNDVHLDRAMERVRLWSRGRDETLEPASGSAD